MSILPTVQKLTVWEDDMGMFSFSTLSRFFFSKAVPPSHSLWSIGNSPSGPPLKRCGGAVLSLTLGKDADVISR